MSRAMSRPAGLVEQAPRTTLAGVAPGPGKAEQERREEREQAERERREARARRDPGRDR
jgi:hypothetical protein